MAARKPKPQADEPEVTEVPTPEAEPKAEPESAARTSSGAVRTDY